MAKPEWGRKHLCQNCGAKFYDLRKEPPTCPSCGTRVDTQPAPRSRRGGGRAAAPKPAEAAEPVAATETPEAAPLPAEEGEELGEVAEAEPIAEGQAEPEAAEEGETEEVADISPLEGNEDSIASPLPGDEEGDDS